MFIETGGTSARPPSGGLCFLEQLIFSATAYKPGPPDGGRALVPPVPINMALLTEGNPPTAVGWDLGGSQHGIKR
jgi:hypothetical protein